MALDELSWGLDAFDAGFCAVESRLGGIAFVKEVSATHA